MKLFVQAKRYWGKRWIPIVLLMVLGAFLLTPPASQASITVPDVPNVFIQTTGEQANLGIGDYYTHTTGDNVHHLVEIYIPCAANTTFRIELFDPDAYDAATEVVNDEVRGAGDVTNYQFRAPDNSPIGGLLSYGPYAQPPTAPPPEHNNWVAYQTINLPATPVEGVDCGSYYIEAWTGNESGVANDNDDDNAWMYRLMGGPGAVGTETFDAALGPDNIPGTGDEAWAGIQRLSYQHLMAATFSFYWFVDDDGTPNWVGRNFDMDDCCSVNYIAPSGTVHPGTVSGSSEWNPGQATRGAGDPHSGEAGLWRGDINISVNNQYIFEVSNDSKPIFLSEPELPNVIVSKDDGQTIVNSPGSTTYTLTITNTGEGAAIPIAGYEIIDTLPPGMTFASCTINPPLIGTCTNAGNLVNIDLQPQSPAHTPPNTPAQPILAYLPSATSGLVNNGTISITATINAGLADGTQLTNTVSVDWTDIYENNYAPNTDDDTDTVVVIPPSADVSVTKTDVQDPVTLGNNVVYQLTVTNNGPDSADNVVVTDTLPPGVTFVAASVGCSETGGIVTCNLGTLNNGDVVNLSITVTPNAVGGILNTVSVSTTTPDPDPSNNGDDEPTTVIDQPVMPSPTPGGPPGGLLYFDPALSKIGVLADGDIGLVGEQITWLLTLVNIGNGPGTNIVITDTLRSELRVDGAGTDRGTVTVTGQTVTFNIPYLNPGESIQMRIFTTVISSPVDGSILNIANLTGTGPNGETVTTSARAQVDTVTGLPATGYPKLNHAPASEKQSRFPLTIIGLGIGAVLIGGWTWRRSILHP